jgi:DNA-binding transcriptional regulator YiaG
MNHTYDKKQAGSPEERAKRVRYLREKVLRFTREVFSEKSGIPINTLQNWEQSRHSGLIERGAKKIIQALDNAGIPCSLEWLLYGIGESPASPFETQRYLTEAEIIAEELELFHRLNPNAIDMVIKDDSMLPYYWLGDTVAGKRYTGEDIKKTVGLACIVETITGGVLIRFLEEAEESGRYNLLCANQLALAKIKLESVELISAAPILWLRRKSHFS